MKSNDGGGALYVISFVSALHLVWAGLLAFSAAAAHSTPVDSVVDVTGSRAAAAAILTVSALLALAATWVYKSPHRIPPLLLVLGLVPQQFFLLASAVGGIGAAVAGHYADGVPRSWPFIVGDQLPVVTIAFLYTTAVIIISRRSLPD